jgi:hypothetical protein
MVHMASVLRSTVHWSEEYDQHAGSWKASLLNSSRRRVLVRKVSFSIAWWPTNWPWVQFSVGFSSWFAFIPLSFYLNGVELFFSVLTVKIPLVIFYTTRCVFKRFCFIPRNLFTLILNGSIDISLYSVNLLVFIMDTECVFYRVGTEILYVTQIAGSETMCCSVLPNVPLWC